jgi:hypothetical protein
MSDYRQRNKNHCIPIYVKRNNYFTFAFVVRRVSELEVQPNSIIPGTKVIIFFDYGAKVVFGGGSVNLFMLKISHPL